MRTEDFIICRDVDVSICRLRVGLSRARESHLGEKFSKFICATYFNSKGNFLISNDTLSLGNRKAVLMAELGLGLN